MVSSLSGENHSKSTVSEPMEKIDALTVPLQLAEHYDIKRSAQIDNLVGKND